MRKLVVSGAALLGALALAVPVGAARADTPRTTSPVGSAAYVPAAPVWGPCTEVRLKSRGAECAKLTVPLDYAHPGGTKIKLAISRVKHTAATYQGLMLVNPGGPGGSGLVYSTLGSSVPDGGGAGYDWIGFDPRGVGDSEPVVSCDPTYAGYNRPRYVPTRSSVKAWMKKTNAYTRACDRNNGAILDHLTTRDSAMDMESIRTALGEPQINYYGFSYGTYLGQVYASLYPTKVRRTVFDGTVDPRRIWYGANLDQDTAFDRNENLWFAWVAKNDATYHLGRSEKAVRSLFYKTQERLYRAPVQADGGKLGGSEWNDSFLYAGYYTSTWTDLAEVFSAFVNDKDVDALEAAYLDASGYGDDNGYAVYLGVQCTDTSWPRSWKTWARDNAKIYEKAPFLTWGNAWYNEPCRHWPAKAQQPVKVQDRGLASLLLVNETLDAATPYAGSLEVRKRFANSRLIATVGGTTHSNSLNGYACVDDAIAAYLADGTLPARRTGNRADATCAKLPDHVPANGAARRQAVDDTLQTSRRQTAVRP